MSFFALFGRLQWNSKTEYSGRGRRPRPRHRPASRPSSFLPRLEALETRLAPATWTVTNDLDNGSTGSLRWAITGAIFDPDPNPLINFASTEIISLSSPLPGLTRAGITIDASGPSGPNGVLDGTYLAKGDGLLLAG